MIVYDKFFNILKERSIKQIDLRNKGVHPRTFQKMQKSELIRSDTISELCKLLNCQPGDIMEYVPDGKVGNTNINGNVSSATKEECAK